MSTKPPDGGQAFPRAGFSGPKGYGPPVVGMTLRDHFAGLAMQAALTKSPNSPTTAAERAAWAYAQADAMIAAR